VCIRCGVYTVSCVHGAFGRETTKIYGVYIYVPVQPQ